MWSFFGSKRVTDKRLENALKSRAGIIKEIIISQENYNSKRLQTSELRFWGFSLPLNLDEMSRNVVKLIRFATKKSIPIFCMKKIFTIRTTEDVYGKAKL